MKNATAQTSSDEINLADIYGFFIRNRGLILIFIALGLFLSGVYIFFTPKKYEARWLLEVAQSNGKALELPTVLIQRLRAPSAYSEDIRQLCEISQNVDLEDYLGGKLKVGAMKGVSNIVELKVTGTSTGQALSCADAITAMIFAIQNKLIEEQTAGSQQQIRQYQESLAEEFRQIERMHKSDVVNFAYLAHLDKYNWLRDRIASLQLEVMAIKPAKLLTPIQVPSKPVAPKMSLALILGGLISMFAAILGAIFRERARSAP